MFSVVQSAVIDGLKVHFVRVEADVSNGLPMFHMVGFLSGEVKEAGERVRTAIRNAQIQLPPKKMMVNLAPATVKKRGASFDLPIAAALLAAYGELDMRRLEGCLLLGELTLNGQILNVPGVLPIVIEAKKAGYHTCILPAGNVKEGMVVKGIQIIGIDTLKGLLNYIEGNEKNVAKDNGRHKKKMSQTLPDFQEIQGQKVLKRTAEIAVSGRHNLLITGQPGIGKTMVAQRIPSILPPLTEEESLEISKVYSIRGMLDEERPLITAPPFRQVHHAITRAALLGGGVIPLPGEASLASGGVLLMDELAEFSREVIEALRQPLEEGEVRIARNQGIYCYPADFLLVAAMNPCPCGYYPDLNRCTCTQSQIQHYLGKISGPFLSRIDLCVEAAPMSYDELAMPGEEECSEAIRERVLRARTFQKKRYADLEIKCNGQLPAGSVGNYCKLSTEGHEMMRAAYEKMRLSGRTYHKILKVARTIADLDESEEIETMHLAEAMGYRMFDDSRIEKGAYYGEEW